MIIGEVASRSLCALSVTHCHFDTRWIQAPFFTARPMLRYASVQRSKAEVPRERESHGFRFSYLRLSHRQARLGDTNCLIPAELFMLILMCFAWQPLPIPHGEVHQPLWVPPDKSVVVCNRKSCWKKTPPQKKAQNEVCLCIWLSRSLSENEVGGERRARYERRCYAKSRTVYLFQNPLVQTREKPLSGMRGFIRGKTALQHGTLVVFWTKPLNKKGLLGETVAD